MQNSEYSQRVLLERAESAELENLRLRQEVDKGRVTISRLKYELKKAHEAIKNERA